LKDIDDSIKYLDLKQFKNQNFFKITISHESQQLSIPLMKQSEIEFENKIKSLNELCEDYFELSKYESHEFKEVNQQINGYRVLSKKI